MLGAVGHGERCGHGFVEKTVAGTTWEMDGLEPGEGEAARKVGCSSNPGALRLGPMGLFPLKERIWGFRGARFPQWSLEPPEPMGLDTVF